jgi:hypothetical protein
MTLLETLRHPGAIQTESKRKKQTLSVRTENQTIDETERGVVHSAVIKSAIRTGETEGIDRQNGARDDEQAEQWAECKRARLNSLQLRTDSKQHKGQLRTARKTITWKNRNSVRNPYRPQRRTALKRGEANAQ